IGDPTVKSEYQAEFRQRFDDHFARGRHTFQQRQPFYPIGARQGGQRGPGRKWTPPLPPVTEDAKRVGAAGGIDRVLAKAVLAGLIRHPAEIARHLEVLGSLKLADGALAFASELKGLLAHPLLRRAPDIR
ncbi:hypothetical protein, partial [Halomonas sp. ND22Bw]|uniref:hypothetical protein n=1 Tax=Halomonas sp. ND22Bw TaxID=2054178 RepID=UPI001C62A966